MRECVFCGSPISACMGFVIARDFTNHKDDRHIRELCGKCALITKPEELDMKFIDQVREEERIERSLTNIYEQKTGAEIAKELGITRQAISNTLKRAIKKVYEEVGKLDATWGPFERAVVMSIIFKVDEVELTKFVRLFPPALRKEIETDAKGRMPGK